MLLISNQTGEIKTLGLYERARSNIIIVSYIIVSIVTALARTLMVDDQHDLRLINTENVFVRRFI